MKKQVVSKAVSTMIMVLVLMALVPWTAFAETDITSKVQLVKSSLVYDRRAKTSSLTVSVKNISQDVLISPLKIIIDTISTPTVTVANADGYTDDGKPFLYYTTQDDLFEPGYLTYQKPLSFSNPNAARFSYTAKVMATIPDAVMNVGPDGGSLTVNDPSNELNGLNIVIPPGALSYEEYITAIHVKKENLPAAFSYAAMAIDFSSNNNFFNTNIEISIPYMDQDNDSIVDGTNIQESEIRVVFFNNAVNNWEEIPIKKIDTENNIVSFEVNHFTIFTLIKKQSFWDYENPKLISLSFPPTVDGTNSDITLNVSVKATDDLSGISYAYVNAYSESGQRYASAFCSWLTSGTKWNGTFQGTMSIPQFNPGKWKITGLYIYDNAGNQFYSDLSNAGYEFNVTGSQKDTEAPQLISLSFPPTVDVTNGDGTLNVSVKATDDLSGISYAYVNAYSESGQRYASAFCSWLTSGTKWNGTFQGTMSIPQWNSTGKWKITSLSIYDNAGNQFWVDLSNENYEFNVTTEGYNEEIVVNTVPNLNQGLEDSSGNYVYEFNDKNGETGPAGCVPTSFGMMILYYSQKLNPYNVNIDISPLSANTINLLNDVATYLSAYVEDEATWVSSGVCLKMQDYSALLDTNGIPEKVIMDWDIDVDLPEMKSCNQWIEFFKEKLKIGEPVVFGGYLVLSSEKKGGHASVITGYKKENGEEYLLLNDTYGTSESWWHVTEYQGYIVLERLENDEQTFAITKFIAYASNVTIMPSF